MKRKANGKRKAFNSIDEFEKEYLPKLRERRMIEAENEESTVFAQRLAASLLENIRKELTK